MEVMERKIFELNKICRICLSEKGKMKSLFDSCLDTMLKSVANIQISLSDGLPELICFQCVLQVSRTFRFKKQCEKSDEILRHYIKTTNETYMNQKCYTEDDIIKQIISFDEDDNEHFQNNLSQSNKREQIIINSLNKVENLNNTSIVLQNDCFTNKSPSEIGKDSLKCHLEIDSKFKTGVDNKSDLIFNVQLESRNLDYSCEICWKIFTNRKALLRHMKIHDNYKRYKCSECDKTFVEKSNLTKHMKKHTGELRNITGKPNLCTVCGKSFKWASSLSKHMQYHTKNKIYKCKHCPKFYVEKRSLDIHLRNHTGEKPFKCKVCCKSFTQLCNLEKHLHVHAKEKPFSCKICNKKFSQSGYIKIHMRSHTGEKPYQCQECGKCFSSSSNLIIHKKRHSGDPTFSCGMGNCTNTFIRLDSDLIHKRTDTGEKPYQCTTCLKNFVSTNQLSRHKQSHLSAKNNISDFICEICNKNCSSNYDLKNHSKMHYENVNNFQCIFCEKKFDQIIERDAHHQDHATKKVMKSNLNFWNIGQL